MSLSAEDFGIMLTGRSITVTYNGEVASFNRDDPTYDKLKQAYKEGRWDDFPSLMSPKSAVSKLSNNQMRVDGNQVVLTDDDGAEWEVPCELSKCILMHVNEDLPLNGLMSFARNLRQNPSRRSVHQLFPWCESANLTITEDGHFLAWKRVKADFKDVHSGTIDNSPGVVVEVPRNMVDDDPNRHCSYGLHVCSWDYLKSFPGEKIVQVKVHPADVVAVPTDYRDTKMRVCKYQVMKEVDIPDTHLPQTPPVTGPLYRDDEEDYDDEEDDVDWY